jgi:hypothetical protein
MVKVGLKKKVILNHIYYSAHWLDLKAVLNLTTGLLKSGALFGGPHPSENQITKTLFKNITKVIIFIIRAKYRANNFNGYVRLEV